ncbi:CCA tRNA nucleotidyltransferase [bacterium]|nr:MAG: CCA tRNA nucleotidyltransferase [bacterium]QQR61774.1 MAG: CCA tRNA nucleotidyltransferase [bacterium]
MDYRSSVEALFQLYPAVKNIVQHLYQQNSTALLVGGAVRDILLHQKPLDYDIEVYGMSLEQLQNELSQFGFVDLVGKSFGVLKIRGLPVDWSVPRFDAQGRKPTVTFNPSMSFIDAFGRRDLTINAMGIDMVTGQLIDPFDGKKDITEKRLRAPSVARFVEDPLRFFRVMQFVGRFEMEPDAELNDACANMDLVEVAQERIEAELKKLFLLSKKPSLAFLWLAKIGRLASLYPELYVTIAIRQDRRWHPEGSVFVHSMQALDAAVQIAVQKQYDAEKRLLLCVAALAHDLGKVTTTFEDAKGVHSYGHERVGAPLAVALARRMFSPAIVCKRALYKLVYYHMTPGALVRNKARLCRYQRLASQLAPEVSMSLLADLCLADRRGRNGLSMDPLQNKDCEITEFLKKATAAQVAENPIKPLVTGADLLAYCKPGPALGKLLQKAYELQLAKAITDRQVLLELVLKI